VRQGDMIPGFGERSGTLPALSVLDLHKSYGDIRAVDGVSFTIEAGEIFGLLGPNGAGKTTTIDIIATLLTPDGGKVSINGTSASSSVEYKRRIGYVPQEISLAERLTATENLRLIGRLYDLKGRVLADRVAETLEAMGLADRAGDFVSTFSGGMKRRLNIAGALLHKPALLLMDEPTAGVDPQARAYIFQIVEGLAAEGRAVLYTTHYMEEAQRLCRRTAIIDHGKILAIGTLEELVHSIKARRDVALGAEELSDEAAADLARRLGEVSWTRDENSLTLNLADTTCSLLEVVHAADKAGIKVKEISLHEPSLETVFLELTGRTLRD